MLTLEKCTRRCLTLFFENYGACKRLNCLKCLAAERRARLRHARRPGASRRDRKRRPANVQGKAGRIARTA